MQTTLAPKIPHVLLLYMADTVTSILTGLVVFCFVGIALCLIWLLYARRQEESEPRMQKETEQHTGETKEDDRARQMKLKDAENMAKAGRYQEAAQAYEELGDWEKAGECRRLDRTTYVVSAGVHLGKDGGISVDCPHCGGSRPIGSKGTSEVTCEFCGRKYIIPKKVLDLL